MGVDRSYANNGLNQTIAAGASSLTWDARSNLASWDGAAYTFTSEKQMIGPAG